MRRFTPLLAAFRRGLRVVIVALLSPIVEKNPQRLLAHDAPLVFSSRRIALLAITLAVYVRLRAMQAGTALGWPDAFLAVFVVLAPYLTAALDKADPAAVLEFGKVLIGRMGIGAVAEPSIWHDDERGEHAEREPVERDNA